ncbi:MAG: bifunctional alpha,alpha-trehalose-phosphate synthase (UDP-forming)/trehalose-phosphatase [SAR202 cluster bacterium]|nr:bifunctional alpha,alpha-trehalose-phosphate synthase (UDP-forming)/trehalose-phosphatase [SAR202 cluster bacterium]
MSGWSKAGLEASTAYFLKSRLNVDGAGKNPRKEDRLIIVANRLPVTVEEDGPEITYKASAGGLATGLGAFYKERKAIWAGWPGSVSRASRLEVANALSGCHNCYPVFLSERLVHEYYDGFSNRSLWPLFHSMPSHARFSAAEWDAYQEANEVFSSVVAQMAKPDDVIWVHDYQLMLLPKLLRQRLPKTRIGFFLHIPFPQYDILRMLPWHKEIIESLLAADLVGFHTYDYTQPFLATVRRLFGYESNIGQIIAGDRVIQVDAFPMGIEFDRFSEGVKKEEARREVEKIKDTFLHRKVVISISRLDYTKGIPEQLEAIREFLQRYPEQHKKVMFVLVVVPSRERVERYAHLRREINELVSHINSIYGDLDWMPIRYVYRSLSFPELLALYDCASVALITPLRDGLNLIAKEFVAAKNSERGVLILSETAGAAKEMLEAIVVNPNGSQEIADALQQALTMPAQEQSERMAAMRRRLKESDVQRWASRFLDSLDQAVSLSEELAVKFMDSKDVDKLKNAYQTSSKRLILLDYDGTLVPFADEPQKAAPSKDLLSLLDTLSEDQGNEVVITSGQIKNGLQRWFKSLPVTIVAEHGAWVRNKTNNKWHLALSSDNKWKDSVRPMLVLFTERVPGSWIEEKVFSLAWHYRKADVQMGMDAARELTDMLTNLTANLEIQVLHGHKVVEVKSTGASKAEFFLRYLSKKPWDFILAAGDDVTDEALFRVLPQGAATVSVGFAASTAVYNLQSPAEVTVVLKKLTDGFEADKTARQVLDSRPSKRRQELKESEEEKHPAPAG